MSLVEVSTNLDYSITLYYLLSILELVLSVTGFDLLWWVMVGYDRLWWVMTGYGGL